MLPLSNASPRMVAKIRVYFASRHAGQTHRNALLSTFAEYDKDTVIANLSAFPELPASNVSEIDAYKVLSGLSCLDVRLILARDLEPNVSETDSDVESDAMAECLGHPAGPFDPMGQTVYCDGSCRKVNVSKTDVIVLAAATDAIASVSFGDDGIHFGPDQ